MPEEMATMIKGQDTARKFFAALLTAIKADCTCETCKILKSIADDMTAELKM